MLATIADRVAHARVALWDRKLKQGECLNEINVIKPSKNT